MFSTLCINAWTYQMQFQYFVVNLLFYHVHLSNIHHSVQIFNKKSNTRGWSILTVFKAVFLNNPVIIFSLLWYCRHTELHLRVGESVYSGSHFHASYMYVGMVRNMEASAKLSDRNENMLLLWQWCILSTIYEVCTVLNSSLRRLSYNLKDSLFEGWHLFWVLPYISIRLSPLPGCLNVS